MMLFEKVAVVTGAATGVGKASAERFACEGARVLAVDIDDEMGTALAREIERAGGTCRYIHADVSRSAEVEAMAESALSEWGGIDILFNNAAATQLCNHRDRAVHELEESVWDTMQAVTLKSVYLCAKFCIPSMLERASGVILNVTSSDVYLPEPGFDSYIAAKGGVVSLTRSMAVNYGKHGIRVNCLSPGYIMTENQEVFLDSNPGMRKLIDGYHLTPYLGQPDDVAHLAVFLASDQARFITGAVIPVDGGYQIFKSSSDGFQKS